MGMVKTYNDSWITKELNVDILAQVHDSVLMQVPLVVATDEHLFRQLRERVYEYVSPELCYNNRPFKIATDSKLGLNWGGAHKEYNPMGMQELDDDNYETVMGVLNVSGAAGLA